MSLSTFLELACTSPEAERTDASRCQTTRGDLSKLLAMEASKDPRISCDFLERKGGDPACQAKARQEVWWSQTGSNRRPHACKARALPTELWPLEERAWKVVGLGGLEPPTSRLSSARSNQLSYKPGTHEPVRRPARGLVRGERETKAAAFRKWPADCRPCVLKRSDKSFQDENP